MNNEVTATWEDRLSETLERPQELADQLRETAQRPHVATQDHEAVAQQQASTVEIDGVKTSVREAIEAKAALQEAQSALLEATNTNEALRTALEARQVELAKVGAERLVALTQLNRVTTERRTLEVQLEAAQVQVSEALSDRRRLQANLAEAEARQRQIAAEADRMQTSQHSLLENQQSLEVALEARQADLAQAVAERSGVLARLDEMASERRRLEGQLNERDVRHEQLMAQLKSAQVAAESGMRMVDDLEAERTRLQQSIELLTRQHQADIAREAADQQRLHVLLDLAAQQHGDLRTRLQDAEEQCREYQRELDQAVAAHRALQAKLHALDASQQEAVTEYGTQLTFLEQRVSAAEAARDKHAEALANREVVLSALAEHLRRLTPLVITGRIARELAPQLRALVDRVDGLATQVLDDCHLEHRGRAELEALRGEAVRARALASELMQVSAELGSSADAVDPHTSRTERRP